MSVANVWAAPGNAILGSDPRLWPTSALTYDERVALAGKMVTQGLYGEQVRILATRGAWSKVVIPDQPSPLDARGYPGWVLTSQLGPSLSSGVAWAIVTEPVATLENGTEVSFGTRLPLILGSRAGTVRVETPGGPSLLLRSASSPVPATRADIVRTAKLFLGLRYLWGGVSAWGFDCSGLAWAIYRAHGVTIPRDADAQFAAGRPIAVGLALPGDLLFYGIAHVEHVAIYLGHGQMIEAPNSASHIRIVPVATSDLAGARSFL